ncbi:MAG: hypothetical protein KAJ58_01900 [Candidatus Pacebacteria bacterium]|nr:hypothetical protein [Candidatus Paceibacterota bacterium]
MLEIARISFLSSFIFLFVCLYGFHFWLPKLEKMTAFKVFFVILVISFIMASLAMIMNIIGFWVASMLGIFNY